MQYNAGLVRNAGMTPLVLFMGGNGHSAARLAPAQRVLARRSEAPFTLVDVPYPGFEGRPRAQSFDAFLDAVAAFITGQVEAGCVVVYGTGIGGLLALCLRARGQIRDVPIVMQGPVLWGLEKRLMPRVLRFRPAQALLLPLFATRPFQRRFAGKYFTRTPSDAVQQAFFDGYTRCTAAPDFFQWLTPALLRGLEHDFAAHPERLDNITMWWGTQDKVVGLQELRWTEAALGHAFPLKEFAAWGHYPLTDDVDDWVQTLAAEVPKLCAPPTSTTII